MIGWPFQAVKSMLEAFQMKNKSALHCQTCSSALAKGDAEFVSEDTFAFLANPPSALGAYCYTCYEAVVRPQIERYEEQMERAKDVNVFFNTQGKESRFIRRTEKPVHVSDCVDRDEALLRLAFLAAGLGKNTLVDVELNSTKILHGKWQTSRWSGKGIPSEVSEAALNRRFVGAPN